MCESFSVLKKYHFIYLNIIINIAFAPYIWAGKSEPATINLEPDEEVISDPHIAKHQTMEKQEDLETSFENPLKTGKLEPYSLLDVEYKGTNPLSLPGLYDKYILGPIIEDGNCFFHAVFTMDGKAMHEMDVFSADFRTVLVGIVISNNKYKNIMRREILQDCKDKVLDGNSNRKESILENLYKKIIENFQYEKKRVSARTAIADELARKRFGIDHSTLANDIHRRQERDEIETETLDQLPTELKSASHPYRDEDLLNLIGDEGIKEYVGHYTDNVSRKYIRIPEGGRGDIASIASVIADSNDTLIHCFLYDTKKSVLNYKESLGNTKSQNIVNILQNGNHFWALYHPEESEERRKGIIQAARNYDEYKALKLQQELSTALSLFAEEAACNTGESSLTYNSSDEENSIEEESQKETINSLDNAKESSPKETDPPSLSGFFDEEIIVEENDKLLPPSRIAFLRKGITDIKKAIKKEEEDKKDKKEKEDKKDKKIHYIDKPGMTLVISEGNPGPSQPMRSVLDAFEFEYPTNLSPIPLGAVLFVDTGEDRKMVLTWGQGRHLLKKDQLEPEFGLRMVGNQARPRSFKKIKLEEPSTNTRQIQTAYNKPTDIHSFSVGDEFGPQLLRQVSIQLPREGENPKKRKFVTLEGSDKYLSLPKKLCLSKLSSLGDRLLRTHKREDFLESLPMMKKFTVITDPVLIQKFEKELFARRKSQGAYSLVFPSEELIVPPGYKYELGVPEEKKVVSKFEEPIDFLREKITECDSLEKFQAFLKTEIKYFKKRNKDKEDTSTVYDWLIFECSKKDSLIVLREGTWRIYDAQYVETIYKHTEKLFEKTNLPPIRSDEEEAEYSERVVRDHEKEWILLDRQTPRAIEGRPNSKVEMCDLLTLNKELIHVKIGVDLAKLSYLFDQGCASFQILSKNSFFRLNVFLTYLRSEMAKIADYLMPQENNDLCFNKNWTQKQLFQKVKEWSSKKFKCEFKAKKDKEKSYQETLKSKKKKKEHNLIYTEETLKNFFKKRFFERVKTQLNTTSSKIKKEQKASQKNSFTITECVTKHINGCSLLKQLGIPLEILKSRVLSKVETFHRLMPLEDFAPQEYTVFYLIASTKGGLDFREISFTSLISLYNKSKIIEGLHGKVVAKLIDGRSKAKQKASKKKPSKGLESQQFGDTSLGTAQDTMDDSAPLSFESSLELAASPLENKGIAASESQASEPNADLIPPPALNADTRLSTRSGLHPASKPDSLGMGLALSSSSVDVAPVFSLHSSDELAQTLAKQIVHTRVGHGGNKKKAITDYFTSKTVSIGKEPSNEEIATSKEKPTTQKTVKKIAATAAKSKRKRDSSKKKGKKSEQTIKINSSIQKNVPTSDTKKQESPSKKRKVTGENISSKEKGGSQEK